MNPSQTAFDLAPLRNDILACTTIGNFVKLYDQHPLFQVALARLQQVVSADGPGNELNNARDWAIRWRSELEEDCTVNECRKACLMVIYEICNRWRKTGSVTEEEIRTVFGRDRVLAILHAAMPLDCAQCLYKMKYVEGGFGMHWVSEQHIEAQPGVWNERLRAWGGRSTMNKRYLCIANLFGLPASNDPLLTTCFTPQVAPWQEGVVGEFAGAVGGDDEMMEAQSDVDFAALEQSIRDCNTVAMFRNVYDGNIFQGALCKLRRIMAAIADPVNWSIDWANMMREEPPPGDAPFCDSVRKALLLFLDRLRECALDTTNDAVTEATIVDTVTGHCIANIVRVVLPMERALCRYTRQYEGDIYTYRYGMYWFSEADAKEEPWSTAGDATIPPCLPWLRDIEGLCLTKENLVPMLLQPSVPEWVADGELDDDDEAME